MTSSTGPRSAAALTALACCGLTACASAAGQASTGGPTSTAPGSRPPAVVVATVADKGHTVTLRPGDRLTIRLNSTYWQFQPVHDQAVLKASRAVVKPRLGGHTVPGSGAGLVTETYLARGPGHTQVVATRSSCGEAMRCTGGTGRFTLTVVVR